MFIHTHTPRARKEHICDMCSRRIQPGETYKRQFMADGDIWTWKECQHCTIVASWYQNRVHLMRGETYDADFVMAELDDNDLGHVTTLMANRWEDHTGKLTTTKQLTATLNTTGATP